jgi:predicted DNA-binding transcriptional regulator AlpA
MSISVYPALEQKPKARPSNSQATSFEASFTPGPEMLTARELEAMLKIDVKTIYGYVQRGLIPYVRIQSNLRFSKPEILAWIEGQSHRPRLTNSNGSRRS